MSKSSKKKRRERKRLLERQKQEAGRGLKRETLPDEAHDGTPVSANRISSIESNEKDFRRCGDGNGLSEAGRSCITEGEDDAASDKNGRESRKRSRRKLEFVYPQKNGFVEPYTFTKRHMNYFTSNRKEQSTESAGRKSVEYGPKSCANESIHDIFACKLKQVSSEIISESKDQRAINSDDDEPPHVRKIKKVCPDNETEGKLSGKSVEEAVRDKYGCRPRANSTDGELNLPRRGFCDENMVLQNHKWGAIGKSFRSSPNGFVNLGNTCFLNSTLQCLAYLPPFSQSLMAMPDHLSTENFQKMSQGKKITLMLRSLFQRAHGSDGQSQNNHVGAIAPRSLVKAVPSLGSYGNRNGYKFRTGRQEDAHEFLVHLLDAMHDGELREAGKNGPSREHSLSY